jgi:hypothetical protein
MSTERQPSASEVLDFMDCLQRDEARRSTLASSWDLYQAAVLDELVGPNKIDAFAQAMQELHGEGLISYGTRSGGDLPSSSVWDGAEVQQMHNWRVTAEGRRDASLFRTERARANSESPSSDPLPRAGGSATELHDVFIAHASEDKDAVARPLAQALVALGWDVWLDELQLTIGDSLSRRIETALSRSRFGIVVLSPAFFAKEWPQRELAGLAAREIDTGSKVILPVWHNVDHHFIVQHSPVLADRLGALTESGIEKVARELSQALGKQPNTPPDPLSSVPADSAEPSDDSGPALFQIPTTDEQQADLVREEADWWEYRLFAGVLMQGRIRLEGKWHDHELRLPGGTWLVPTESAPDFLSYESGAISRYMQTLDRVFDPGVQEQAFGAPGVAGDPSRITHIALAVTKTYEGLMDWAAELRRNRVASEYEELLELNARMVDPLIRQIRDFIQHIADQIARIPLLIEEASAKGATPDAPMTLDLTLHVELDQENQERIHAAIEHLS